MGNLVSDKKKKTGKRRMKKDGFYYMAINRPENNGFMIRYGKLFRYEEKRRK